MSIQLRERQCCDNDNIKKSLKRTRIVTVNRNYLSQTQHIALLSTPKGHAWTGSHDLSFIMEKCRKSVRIDLNDSRRENKKHAFLDVNTTMWPLFVKQFLQHAEYSLAPTTRTILTKILLSRVNFSDPKWSSYRNTQTELCRFLRNLNPECDSIHWKGNIFRTLSFLIFDYMVQVLCSGQILKKQKINQVILKKINGVTNEYVLLNSSDNFLQVIQIFIANMLSPWLEKPINDICSKVTSNYNKDLKNRITMNYIVNHRIDMKTKHSKNNELDQNKINRLQLKNKNKAEINHKSKKGQFKKLNKINNKKKINTDYAYQTVVKKKITNEIENHIIDIETRHLKNNQNKTNIFKLKNTKKGQFKKTIIKDSIFLQTSNKAANKIKTNRKPKKGLKLKSVIDAMTDSKKIIGNHEILSNSVFVKHPINENIIKKKIKNNMVNYLGNKSKKNKILKTTVKSKLSQQNLNKARKTIKTNEKPKKGLKSKLITDAVNDLEKIIENNEMLSNSIDLKHLLNKNASETKIKSIKNSIIPEDENHSNINSHDKNINRENSNYRVVPDNEKILKSVKQLYNENTIETNSNDNKENFFNNTESVRAAKGTENTNVIIDTNHDGRNDDDQRNTAVDGRFKSHYENSSSLLTKYSSSDLTGAILNGITDSYINNANEDDGMLNSMDDSEHTFITKYLSGEIHNTNILKGEELLKYNDESSLKIHEYGYSDVIDYDNDLDNDEEHHIKIMNVDGEEFETRVLDDLANVFLDSSSVGWNNKFQNTTQVMESRDNKSKQNCFQRCADCYTQKADNFRNKESTRPENYDQNTGVTYTICKKNGSNYSVCKTIFPLCKNRDHQSAMCLLDKSKLVVNTLIQLKY